MFFGVANACIFDNSPTSFSVICHTHFKSPQREEELRVKEACHIDLSFALLLCENQFQIVCEKCLSFINQKTNKLPDSSVRFVQGTVGANTYYHVLLKFAKFLVY